MGQPNKEIAGKVSLCTKCVIVVHIQAVIWEEDMDKEEKHMKKVLSISGYTRWAWHRAAARKWSPTSDARQEWRRYGHITLLYYEGVSEAHWLRGYTKLGWRSTENYTTRYATSLWHRKTQHPPQT